MRNIKYMGNFKEESQLLHGRLYENAVQFKEENSTGKMFVKGLLVSSPIMIAILILAIVKILPLIDTIKSIKITSFLLYTVVLVM